MSTTTTPSRHIRAGRSTVYRALVDGPSVALWRAPEGMSPRVHHFDPRPAGTFGVSLTYEDPARTAKSSGSTDTYHGRFATLVADELVVEVLEFETTDPGLAGPMTALAARRARRDAGPCGARPAPARRVPGGQRARDRDGAGPAGGDGPAPPRRHT